MGKPIEPISNSGFTPFIIQQQRFRTLKKSTPIEIHPDIQGTLSILVLDGHAALTTSPKKHDLGLISVANADIYLPPVANQLSKPLPKKYQCRLSLPKTFHKFARLPTELRVKIWGYIVPIDRVVAFTVRGKEREIFKPTNASVPVVLQACQESRYVALKSLKPMFHTMSRADCYNFFDVNTDVLKLSLECARRLATTRDYYANKDRELVKHLQIPCHIDPNDPFMGDAIAAVILRAASRSWGSLETLYLSGREARVKKYLIQHRVTLPKDLNGADKEIHEFGKIIQKQLEKALEEQGRRVDIAIRVMYD